MAGPNESDPLRFLAVTSHLKGIFSSRFHGDTYEWQPGETLNLTEEAARHIFGYGLTDKSAAFQRNGWQNSRHDAKHAAAMLAKFDFKPVQQVFEISRARSSLSDRPLAQTGEGGGGEGESLPAAPGEVG